MVSSDLTAPETQDVCVVGLACNKLNFPDFRKKPQAQDANPWTNLQPQHQEQLGSAQWWQTGPRKEYFPSFQVPAMEWGAGSLFSLHGHGQLVCSMFSSPVYGWNKLCPTMSVLLLSSHHLIYLAALPHFCPYYWIVSISLWLWVLACRIALIKTLMKGNANKHFACILK